MFLVRLRIALHVHLPSTPFPFGPFGVRFSVLSRELVKRQQQFSEQVAGIVQMPLGVIVAGDGPSELRSTLEKGMSALRRARPQAAAGNARGSRRPVCRAPLPTTACR
jgi:hypothetical protein